MGAPERDGTQALGTGTQIVGLATLGDAED